jgi:hypothetical protein
MNAEAVDAEELRRSDFTFCRRKETSSSAQMQYCLAGRKYLARFVGPLSRRAMLMK